MKTAAIEIGCVMLSHSDLGDMIRGMTGNSAPHACSARSGVQQCKGRAVFVTRDVLLVGRAKPDCLKGGTHEETLRPQVNPKVEW